MYIYLHTGKLNNSINVAVNGNNKPMKVFPRDYQYLMIINISYARGGGYLGHFLLGLCHCPFRAPSPIIVDSVANYRLHLSHFWTTM